MRDPGGSVSSLGVGSSCRRGRAWILVLLVSVPGGTGTDDAMAREVPRVERDSEHETLPLSSDLRIRVVRGQDIELEARLHGGEDFATVAVRLAGGRRHADALAAWNGSVEVEAGLWVRVPLALLSDDYRRLVLVNLFPQDRREAEDWMHVALAGKLPTYDEGLWQVAEWFTGDGTGFRELMRVNGLTSPELRADQRVRIPAGLLHPALRVKMRSDDGALEYGSDDLGPYAGYALKAGEALYTAVVVRFTGRTEADDVGALTEAIRERNAIPDLRDIPVGYVVKIPFALLEPDFLPKGHPKRIEAEAARRELEQELEQRPVLETPGGLEGVLVVLDPGHGGKDLGTMGNGIWEHDYVYDVACRFKQRLEEQTAARVVLTLEDKETGCVPSRTDKLDPNRQGTILTTPPFLARENGEARIGVNLRWYLSNSIYRRSLNEGVDADRVLFISLHADSRHPSLRGVMVYVPGAGYRTKTYGFKSGVYRKYEEVKEKPFVRFSKKSRVRSEAVSRRYADAVVEAFRSLDLPVQSYQPVRNRIIRGREKFVPAVLRGNEIPNKVLVEMLNVSNPDDAALLASAVERDRLARGLVRSLLLYFGEATAWSAASGSASGAPGAP